MRRVLGVVLVLITLCCIIVGQASADRLILTPTGDTLGTGGIKAEAAINGSDDGQAYWASVGLSRFEAEAARFVDYGPDDVDSLSLQVSILPETSFTPAIAIGVRDISDKTDGEGTLYDGRSFYAAASKGIPITGGIPGIFENVRVHGGIGTGSLSGMFIGVEGRLPIGLNLSAEYDTEDINAAVSYDIASLFRIKAATIKGDFYYGASFSTRF